MHKKQDFFIVIPQSLVDIAEDKIRQMIISGELELGELITEMRLSEMFNLSKTPIREALLRLSAAERLVEIKPRQGTRVFSLSTKDIDDISATRITLEQGALRLAMRTSHELLINDLNDNITASRLLLEQNNDDLYRNIDSDFHHIFLKHTYNPYLLESYRLIFTKVQAMRNRLNFSRDYIHNSIHEHAEILNEVIKKNVDSACYLIEKHIKNGFSEHTKHLLSTEHER